MSQLDFDGIKWHKILIKIYQHIMYNHNSNNNNNNIYIHTYIYYNNYNISTYNITSKSFSCFLNEI